MYQLKLNDPHFLPQSACEVEFSLKKGEVITLVGKNGLGKTTLMRRFYQESGLQLSFIEQAPMDFFYDRKLAVLRSIFLSARGHAIAEKFFLELWHLFNFHQKENRLLSQLSGGEGQALKICMGLAAEKDIFLLDEPSQYLDETAKEQLKAMLENLLQAGKSIVMIEHDLTWQKFPMTITQLEEVEGILKRGKTWNT